MWEMLKSTAFYGIVGRSLGNVLLGIVSAILCGTLLAILTHRVSLLRDLILPLMTVIKATPVASFIILALIWIGSSLIPVLITFLIVLPVVWTNLDVGLGRQDAQLAEVAKVYRFSLFKRFRFLTLPAVKPYFISACRTSLGIAWKAGIAAEIISRPRGTIGIKMSNAQQYLETEEMFVWTLTVVLLSLLIESGFVALLNLWDSAPREEVTA